MVAFQSAVTEQRAIIARSRIVKGAKVNQVCEAHALGSELDYEIFFEELDEAGFEDLIEEVSS